MEICATKNYLDINVGGTIVKIPKSIMSQFEDTALEALFSGRHDIEVKNGVPFINRDPEVF